MALVKSLTFQLPDWMFSKLDLTSARHSDDARMALAIEIAELNVGNGGGPFGAVVFDAESGLPVGLGCNLVVAQGCSLLHAEIVAVALAQAAVGSFTLGHGAYELVASSEPCVQCLGAVHWSGVRRLVCGAPVAAAQAAGFDEGPRAVDWTEQLELRGIQVELNVMAASAARVLQRYQSQGGLLYNARPSIASRSR
jgi:tRNA(Arg) A34 adenosine deaminase TadA